MPRWPSYWMHVACLMASEAQLEWEVPMRLLQEEVWGSSFHLNRNRKADFRSPARRGKVSCIFPWGRRMTPQMMPIIGRSQNFPARNWVTSHSVTKFCITSHGTLDIMYLLIWCNLKYKFICEILLPKCLIYISWSHLYLRFSLQEIQGLRKHVMVPWRNSHTN